MRTITITTHLAVDPDIVRKHAMTPVLLNYVAAGLIKFQPIEPEVLPDRWVPGKYKVRMLAFHIFPIGWQYVGIELPEESDEWFLRDNGRGSIARVWDHQIYIEPDRAGTRYVDRVSIDAGILTWPVLLYAILFFRHRQRRWRKLVELGFEPLLPGKADAR